MNKNPKSKIYADNSATTKVREEAIDLMLEVLENHYGNPSSIHSLGKKAKEYLENARYSIAKTINAKSEEIFFTSGGTESNNLAILGIANNLKNLEGKENHIISTKIEHPSVKESLEHLQSNGWKIDWLNVDKEGFINLEELNSLTTPKTLLVSIIHANNEIGTIQDLKQISKICKLNNVLFHTDAVQSFTKTPINVEDIDLMSFSSHKISGPKGVGGLFIKDKTKITQLLFGGAQENKIRPGTENLPGIAGFGKASELSNAEINIISSYLRKLQIQLMEHLAKLDNIMFTGPGLTRVKENLLSEKYLYRIPGHVSICCKNIEGESLVLKADLRGIALSSGSACKRAESESKIEPSHVLKAIKVSEEYIKGSLRIVLGKENTSDEVIYISQTINDIACFASQSKEEQSDDKAIPNKFTIA